ncbi:nucleotide exchange factor GrpE [Candidatus Poribacteria bacterium]|nr:nucleotide exchange factor GrpE [Candidatus Poribacteria bacterium]
MSENEKTQSESEIALNPDLIGAAEIVESIPDASETDNRVNEITSEKPEPDPLSPEVELARMKAEYEARYDQMLRTIAEFENTKKRAEREKEEFLKYALEGIVKDLIPTVDNIERAIESTKQSKDFDALAEGIQMIHKQFLNLLERRGVTPIEAVGQPFDPTQHEAIVLMESEEFPENRVIQEFQRGYLLHDRVVRPAMVSVSKGGGEKEEVSNE